MTMAPSSAGGRSAGWREANQPSSSHRTLEIHSETVGGWRHSPHVPSRDFVTVIGIWDFYTPVGTRLQAGLDGGPKLENRKLEAGKSTRETRRSKLEIRKANPKSKIKIQNPQPLFRL
jgi:hypothetical protein